MTFSEYLTNYIYSNIQYPMDETEAETTKRFFLNVVSNMLLDSYGNGYIKICKGKGEIEYIKIKDYGNLYLAEKIYNAIKANQIVTIRKENESLLYSFR